MLGNHTHTSLDTTIYFSETSYNFSKMENKYEWTDKYTFLPLDRKYDIATLIYHIGIAVNMNYKVAGASAGN